MARIDKKKQLRPSILDRLLDDEPHLQVEAASRGSNNIEQIRRSVKRDLENLLNTRFRVVQAPEEFSQLEHSLLNYGLPDLATVNGEPLEGRRQVCAIIENVVRKYEPRLTDVRASLLPATTPFDRDVRFRIEGRLSVDPAPDVVFDTTLELSTGEYKVRAADSD